MSHCHTGSNKAHVQMDVAVSGNCDILDKLSFKKKKRNNTFSVQSLKIVRIITNTT